MVPALLPPFLYSINWLVENPGDKAIANTYCCVLDSFLDLVCCMLVKSTQLEQIPGIAVGVLRALYRVFSPASSSASFSASSLPFPLPPPLVLETDALLV